ncbi:MAG TPA: outer membrane beta-barrel protein [Flavihumibacter sp.]|jgi:iron complex outermembrane receptor protein
MKRTLTLLTLALSTLSFVGMAQTSTSVKGRITDRSNKPAEAATVTVLLAADSSVAKIQSSDKSGNYEILDLSFGRYILLVSAVGFEKQYSDPFELNAENISLELPVVALEPVSKELQGVTVVQRKPFIEQKIDKTVVNVDAAVTNVGANALEVLEKSPGVMVDKDGNISLKGKQSVMVMMDGRPTYLTGEQLASLLKSMPASQIDQIELVTNPSAKYDAAGNSGVINIKTKKNKQKGFNGSLTLNAGQGKYWKTNNSVNANYRTGKFNFFANGSFNIWNSFQQLDIDREFSDAISKEVTAIFEQSSYMKNENRNYTLKFGADYYLSKKTTLGFVLNGNNSHEKQSGGNTSYMKDPKSFLDSVITANNMNKELWKNRSVNLNMRHQFDSTGREITADLDYLTYGTNSRQMFLNSIYDSELNLKYDEQLRGRLPIDIDIYSAKIDYTQPLGKGAKMEAGFKTSMVRTENVADYANFNGELWENDYGKSNNFDYKENILAGYLNYNRQIKKLGIQAGLRYEHTRYEGKQFGNPERSDSSFSRGYGSLFPTLFLSYAATDKNQFAFSYGRRIDRPAYQDMNPFLFFLDKYTYGRGNPYLQPQFTHNIELSHTYNSFLTTTFNYSYTKNFFSETFSQGNPQFGEPEYATVVRQGNIGSRNNVGVAVSAQVPVQKWWTAILYTNYNYNSFKGELNNEEINVSAGTLLLNVNNQFKFEKGWSAELSGWYRSKGVEGQILIDPLGAVAAGVSKQVLKGKGTLKLSARDMFYTQKVTGTINFQTTKASFYNLRDTRVVNLSFVYRFGKPIKGVQPRRKIGGANDEQNRVKMGGNN